MGIRSFSGRSGECELWLAGADGARAGQITSFGGLPAGSPNWSPDGSRLVFDAVKGGRSVIYTSARRAVDLFMQDAWDNMMPCSDEPVDAVVGRLVLLHVAEPVLVARDKVRNLRAGGACSSLSHSPAV
jgi:hypothetical protein